MEIAAPHGDDWILIGVADGVTESTWAARGARHASAAFIEAFEQLMHDESFPDTPDKLQARDWGSIFAKSFHERILERLSNDRDLILKGGFIDPLWSAEFYEKVYLSDPNGFQKTNTWFQSTLLAAGLGPYGGIALFLGDGFARVDRYYSDGTLERVRSLDAQERPEHPVSLMLTQREVFNGIARLLPKGATNIGLLLTTDGVSNSTEEGIARAFKASELSFGAGQPHPLDVMTPSSTLQCEDFLNRLALLPQTLVDSDNMSIAFAIRPVRPPAGGV